MSYTPPTKNQETIWAAYNTTAQGVTRIINQILEVDQFINCSADSGASGGVAFPSHACFVHGEVRTTGVSSYSDTYTTHLTTDSQTGGRGYQGSCNVAGTINVDDGNYIVSSTGDVYLRTYAFGTGSGEASDAQETRLFGLILNQ
jgi:hypothetical protein